MRIALFGQRKVRVVGHIGLRNFFPRPKSRKVGISSAMPLVFSTHKPLLIKRRKCGEESTTVDSAFVITIGTVTLNRVHGNRSSVPKPLYRLACVLFLAAMTTGKVRLFGNRPSASVYSPAVSKGKEFGQSVFFPI